MTRRMSRRDGIIRLGMCGGARRGTWMRFCNCWRMGKWMCRPLITHSFAIENAGAAYEVITGKTGEPHLGVVITYPEKTPLLAKDARNGAPGGDYLSRESPTSRKGREKWGTRLELISRRESAQQGPVRVGVLGAGNFAQGILIPAMKAAGAEMVGLCASSGARAKSSADKFGFGFCTTDEEEVYSDASINTDCDCYAASSACGAGGAGAGIGQACVLREAALSE